MRRQEEKSEKILKIKSNQINFGLEGRQLSNFGLERGQLSNFRLEAGQLSNFGMEVNLKSKINLKRKTQAHFSTPSPVYI